MAGGDFTPVLEIVLFCCSLFVAGVLCKKIGFSPIIGEMCVGVALGPNGADLVPYLPPFNHALSLSLRSLIGLLLGCCTVVSAAQSCCLPGAGMSSSSGSQGCSASP